MAFVLVCQLSTASTALDWQSPHLDCAAPVHCTLLLLSARDLTLRHVRPFDATVVMYYVTRQRRARRVV